MTRRGETAALARWQVERAWAEDVRTREEESLEVRLGELLGSGAVRDLFMAVNCAGSVPDVAATLLRLTAERLTAKADELGPEAIQ